MEAIVAAGSYVVSAFAATAAGSASLAQAATVIAVNAAASIGLNVAANALMRPQAGTSGPTLEYKSDPAAPIRGVFGRMAVGGNEIFKRTWGKTNVYLTTVALLSLGPCESIDRFKANGTTVTFGGSQGAATSGFFANNMWQTRSMGLPGGSALTPPTGVFNGSPAMTGWTSAHKATGHVSAMWTLALAEDLEKRDMYTNGVPAPLWIGKWQKVWDPRLDSTYPGGSGPQRRDEWDTWAWTANPYLHAIAWVRGHAKLNADGTVDRSKRIAGIGAPDRLIRLGDFVEGANVADANGWTAAGEWATTDDKWQVLAGMLQAGGGEPLNRGAQIGCLAAMPRTSILTYVAADLIGEATVKAMVGRRERKNTIVPRYRSEAHEWEMVPAGAVSSSVYVAEDRGETRSAEVEYRYVTSAKQAAELAAYDLANRREALDTSLPSKPYLLGLTAGDAFDVDVPELGLNGQQMIVRRRTFEPQSAVVTLEARSETAAKHAWALGQSANPPPTVSLTAYDPTVAAPEAGDWTLTSEVFVKGGVPVPTLLVVGAAGNYQADAVVFEYRAVGTTDWTPVGVKPVAARRVEIAGLTNLTAYEVAVSYRVRGVVGARRVLGPVTSGSALPISSVIGAGVVLDPAEPLGPGSPPDTSIAVAAFTATLLGGEVLSLPSATIAGLTADTTYAVFRDLVDDVYVAASSSLTGYFSSLGRYLPLGYQATAVDSGGGYSPPPPPSPGGGGGYCPDVDTPILLADGTTRRAGDLKAGDYVRTMHEGSLIWTVAAVYAVETTTADRVTLTAGGRALTATPGHRVHVQGRGFIAIEDLAPGDILSGDEARAVESVAPAGPGVVVRISVQGAQTYVSNGILSHNLKPKPTWDPIE